MKKHVRFHIYSFVFFVVLFGGAHIIQDTQFKTYTDRGLSKRCSFDGSKEGEIRKLVGIPFPFEISTQTDWSDEVYSDFRSRAASGRFNVEPPRPPGCTFTIDWRMLVLDIVIWYSAVMLLAVFYKKILKKKTGK